MVRTLAIGSWWAEDAFPLGSGQYPFQLPYGTYGKAFLDGWSVTKKRRA